MQVRILKALDYDLEKFAIEIGWLNEPYWITYRFANFSLGAPRGHLPIGGPDGLLFADDDSGGFFRSIGKDMWEMGKAAYADLRRPGGLWRSARTIFRAKVLGSKNPMPDEDLGFAYMWIYGRGKLLRFLSDHNF